MSPFEWFQEYWLKLPDTMKVSFETLQHHENRIHCSENLKIAIECYLWKYKWNGSRQLTHTNEVFQIATNNAICMDVKWFLRTHHHDQDETFENMRIAIPFRVINHSTEIDEIRVQHLAKEKQEKCQIQKRCDHCNREHHLMELCPSITLKRMEHIISINWYWEVHFFFQFTIWNSSKLLHMHIMLGVTVIKTTTFIMSANCWAQLQMSSISFILTEDGKKAMENEKWNGNYL